MNKNYKLIAIAAVGVDSVIGIDNAIPWSIKEDLKHYRKTTINNTVICGHKTYKHLPPKALELRDYIVITRNQELIDFKPNHIRSESLLSTLKEKSNNNNLTFFLSGGEFIYNEFLTYCDEAIITWVHKFTSNGNKFFPVDKLYDNFEPINDVDWVRSESGVLYKTLKYQKI